MVMAARGSGVDRRRNMRVSGRISGFYRDQWSRGGMLHPLQSEAYSMKPYDASRTRTPCWWWLLIVFLIFWAEAFVFVVSVPGTKEGATGAAREEAGSGTARPHSGWYGSESGLERRLEAEIPSSSTEDGDAGSAASPVVAPLEDKPLSDVFPELHPSGISRVGEQGQKTREREDRDPSTPSPQPVLGEADGEARAVVGAVSASDRREGDRVASSAPSAPPPAWSL